MEKQGEQPKHWWRRNLRDPERYRRHVELPACPQQRGLSQLRPACLDVAGRIRADLDIETQNLLTYFNDICLYVVQAQVDLLRHEGWWGHMDILNAQCVLCCESRSRGHCITAVGCKHLLVGF